MVVLITSVVNVILSMTLNFCFHLNFSINAYIVCILAESKFCMFILCPNYDSL